MTVDEFNNFITPIMPYFVYIIQSDTDNSYYKGFTQDYSERVKNHNAGLSKYTSRKTPWRLIYLDSFENKTDTLKREKVLKKFSHEQIKNLIDSPRNKEKHPVDEWLKSIPNVVGD